ncbi:hypothetical protein LDL08_25970 [Nonomuraea glycinis]|nr:hypothetical protein [Nonomuraea glycinis]MCA2179633.1 hypothetical protein [Nonomuraea glycinis]
MPFSYRAQHLLQLMIKTAEQTSTSFPPEACAKLFEPLVEELSTQQWADLCVAVGTVVPLPAETARLGCGAAGAVRRVAGGGARPFLAAAT